MPATKTKTREQRPKQDGPKPEVWELRLYVAGQTPKSTRAFDNLKALCEEAAEKAMPGRVTNIRPGYIVGPLDTSNRFNYWPVRTSKGGEMLARCRPARRGRSRFGGRRPDRRRRRVRPPT